LERQDFCAVLGTNTKGLHITLAIPNSFFRENIETKSETLKSYVSAFKSIDNQQVGTQQ